MAYLHDVACSHKGQQCGCICRARGLAPNGPLSDNLGERYLPEVFDGDDSLGIALLKKAVTAAGRLIARKHAIKGKMAERLMTMMPQSKAAMAEAKVRALREGIDPRTVKFTRNVKGVHNDGVDRQLTDGVIYGRTSKGKVRILNVFESKARSSLRDIAFRPGKDLGQIGRDFERLKELPLKIDGQYVQPENVLVSRHQTAWTVFSPKGTSPTAHEANEVRNASGFDMRHVELPYSNAQLAARAAAFVKKRPVK